MNGDIFAILRDIALGIGFAWSIGEIGRQRLIARRRRELMRWSAKR